MEVKMNADSKKVLCLYGVGNCGKSAAIVALDRLIQDSGSAVLVQNLHPEDSGEVCKIYNAGGILIGIESVGDPDSRQPESLGSFVKENCSIIICASRTSGWTVDNVIELQKHGYEIFWLSASRVYKDGNQPGETHSLMIQRNTDGKARFLYDIVCDFLNGTY